MSDKEFSDVLGKAYKMHQIPHWYVFKPYFDWVENNRCGGIRPCRIREMQRAVLSILKKYDEKHPEAFIKMGETDGTDSFFPYDAYGEDKEIVSVINRINEELINYLILSMG